MEGGAALSALSGLVDNASEYLEYWREHKGEEVVIRETELERVSEGEYQFSRTTFSIHGTVKDVLSLPPGFVLTDVQEKMSYSHVTFRQRQNQTKPSSVHGGNEGEQVLREVDEKFVVFSAIEELERAENTESAHEPFRD